MKKTLVIFAMVVCAMMLSFNNADSIRKQKREYVDLGLPSGVKWATCNVGADSPEDYGDYFAWGETRPKSSYTKSNSTTYGKKMRSISSDSRYDVASAIWGGNWRIPTMLEFEELIDYCTFMWTSPRGKVGYKVTGPNGNSIFLPAAGAYINSDLEADGISCVYWTSTTCDEASNEGGDAGCSVYALFAREDMEDDQYELDGIHRYFGMSVRPVID